MGGQGRRGLDGAERGAGGSGGSVQTERSPPARAPPAPTCADEEAKISFSVALRGRLLCKHGARVAVQRLQLCRPLPLRSHLGRRGAAPPRRPPRVARRAVPPAPAAPVPVAIPAWAAAPGRARCRAAPGCGCAAGESRGRGRGCGCGCGASARGCVTACGAPPGLCRVTCRGYGCGCGRGCCGALLLWKQGRGGR